MEPKLEDRRPLENLVSSPLVAYDNTGWIQKQKRSAGSTTKSKRKPEVMRKQMTRVIGEVLENVDNAVYLGEDVRHGGYYLVTDGEQVLHRAMA